VITVPDVKIDLDDAVEIAETLTFLTDWLSGSQHNVLADSLTAFVGDVHYDIVQLAADLHRFVLHLPSRLQPRRTALRRTTMINTERDQHPALDRITRITTARGPIVGFEAARRLKRRSRVGVRSGLLDVAQRHAGVKCSGDKRMPPGWAG
jgi:hypothetical protein